MTTIGADPELFFKDMNSNRLISAIGKIGGTKTEPRRLLGDFCLQEDNVSVEYNIPACNSIEKFVWSNQLMLTEISRIADAYECKAAIQSSGIFDDEQLAEPAARVFGCDPDFDAWELCPNPAPASANPNLRSAGGHIHVGMPGATNKDKISMIRALDLVLGVPMAFLDPTSERRELYGRAGACRFKPYGVEYRTPSNIWLTSEEMMMTVFSSVSTIAANLKDWSDYANKHEELIKKAINTLDENAYKDLHKYVRNFWSTGILKNIKLKKVEAVEENVDAIQWVE